MPMWEKLCQECDQLFSVICKHDEKDKQYECPHCGSLDSVWMLSAPMTSMRSERFVNRESNGFREVLSKIKERNPRTEICKR